MRRSAGRSVWGGGLLRWVVPAMLVLLAAGPVQAQRWYFRAYGGDDGLSQLTGQAFFQDRDGYLWVGTRAGLNRFDGARFEVFSIQQGLANDWINAITQDEAGTIWVATNNGVSSYTPAAGFVNYSVADGLPDKQALHLAADPDGAVWVGTASGLARWDGTRFVSYHEAHGLPAQRITSLVVGPDRRLWVGTLAGLYVQRSDGFHPAPVPELDGQFIVEVDVEEDGTLWVALGQEVRAYRAGRLVRHVTQNDGLAGVTVLHLLAGRDGRVWLRTNQGVAYLDGETVQPLTVDQGLPLRTVVALFEDREGIVWVGGIGGIAKFVGRPFTNYTHQDGLGSNTVWRIQRDTRGDLWVATTGGLSRRSAAGWRTYTTRDGLSHDYIRDVFIDRAGQVWAATQAGLDRFDGARFVPVALGQLATPVMLMAEDREGYLWVSTTTQGLLRGKDGVFEAVDVPGQRFTNARLLVARNGIVWVSGDFGLSRWDGVAWHTYTVRDGLAANEPYFLAEDQDGTLWFGYHSSHGITRFDGTTFTTWTTEDGLSNNAVYSVGVDAENNVWIGTARGLDCFDGQRFISFGTADGYVGSESNAGAFFADTDGTLWFGAIGGLSQYDPRHDLSGGPPPPVQIDALRLGDTEAAPGTIIQVPYAQNDLWARVAALSYINAKQIGLRYRLHGYSNDWKPLQGREVGFTNLPPGTYTLEVQGQKFGGPWSAPAKATVTILPPFWRTWWFGVLMVGLAGSLGGLLFRWRMRRITAHNAWLKETVHRLQEAERLKNEFLANMSHEIRTPLTGILGFAAILSEEVVEAQQEFVHHITRNAERLQRTLSAVLDLAQLKHGAVQVDLAVCDIATEVEEAVALIRPAAEEKCLALDVRVTAPDARAYVDRASLNRVLDILIDNAIKFTETGGVVVEVGRAGGQVYVRVQDTGIGIPDAFVPHLFEEFKQASSGTARTHEGNGLGLTITKRLMTLMGGTVAVESAVGEGSTFTVAFIGYHPDRAAPVPPCHEQSEAGHAAMAPAAQGWLKRSYTSRDPLRRLFRRTARDHQADAE